MLVYQETAKCTIIDHNKDDKKSIDFAFCILHLQSITLEIYSMRVYYFETSWAYSDLASPARLLAATRSNKNRIKDDILQLLDSNQSEEEDALGA